MATVRQETQFLRDSLTAFETIDLAEYDRVGRFTTNGEVRLCAANETPQFLFMESAETDQAVALLFLGMGQVKLALSGSGSKGQKLSAGASGVIVAGTAEENEGDEDDFGIALADWVDGQEVECFLYPFRTL